MEDMLEAYLQARERVSAYEDNTCYKKQHISWLCEGVLFDQKRELRSLGWCDDHRTESEIYEPLNAYCDKSRVKLQRLKEDAAKKLRDLLLAHPAVALD